MTEEDYKKKIKNLKNDINEIITIYEGQPKSFISSKLMARLREEYIFVKNSYINKFEIKGQKVTIDPFAEEVKTELEEGDEEGKDDNQFCRIYAYSFGPFKPRHYFEGNIVTFQWIIWEPYLCDLIQMTGRAEGFAQDMHYTHWGEIKKNSTMTKIVTRTRLILEEMRIKYDGSEAEIMNQVMNHISILEVNHFPCLALAYDEEKDRYDTDSDKELIKKWTDLNIDLIKLFVKFEDADVVVGGGVLQRFHTIESYYDVIIESIKRGDGKVLSKLRYRSDPKCLEMKSRFIESIGNYIIPTIEGPIFIQANHPCREDKYPDVWAIQDGKRIKEWYDFLKGNREMESPQE